jgi:hypothetical protein
MATREPGESSAVPSEPEERWIDFNAGGCSVATSLTVCSRIYRDVGTELMTQITVHGGSGTGEEDKSFNPGFYHIRKGGAWKIQESLEAKSGLGKVYECPCPSGTQISAVFNILYGFSDDVQSVTLPKLETQLKSRKAQYLRGADGKKEFKPGKACTYVASQLSEWMERNMPNLEKQDVEVIGFGASVFDANGKKMTCYLEARMAKTVRFPKYRSRADFDKSKASKETFGQQLRRRSEEESAKLDSRNATSTGRSIGGTESLTDVMDTDNEQDKQFWMLAIGIDDQTWSQKM